MWAATVHTEPRIDKAGQPLVAEDGSIVESGDWGDRAILGEQFHEGPPRVYKPRAGGQGFERVDSDLVGSLLAKAANKSAPGDDHISLDIIKVF